MGSFAKPAPCGQEFNFTDLWVSGLDHIEPLPDGMYRLSFFRNDMNWDGSIMRCPSERDVILSGEAMMDAVKQFIVFMGCGVHMHADGQIELMP